MFPRANLENIVAGEQDISVCATDSSWQGYQVLKLVFGKVNKL
jgi:hypothetical protein